MATDFKKIRKKFESLKTIEKFKRIMITMYMGYPEFIYWGLFEEQFGNEFSERILQKLKDDGLVESFLVDGERAYNLTSKGLDFSLAMINLNLSQKTYGFSKKMHYFTNALVVMTLGMFFFSFLQLIIAIGF
jgi:hypothetical protein